MAKIVLVTGGARSGKSAFAETNLSTYERVLYIATGLSRTDDTDWQERVRLHRERRPASWQTYEAYQQLASYLSQQNQQAYLLDCATMLTSNRLFDLVAEKFPDKQVLTDDNFLNCKEQARLIASLEEEWRAILQAARHNEGEVWIVTDEVGLGIVPDTPLGRFFRDLQGRINQLLAKEASEVYLVICGLAQRLK